MADVKNEKFYYEKALEEGKAIEKELNKLMVNNTNITWLDLYHLLIDFIVDEFSTGPKLNRSDQIQFLERLFAFLKWPVSDFMKENMGTISALHFLNQGLGRYFYSFPTELKDFLIRPDKELVYLSLVSKEKPMSYGRMLFFSECMASLFPESKFYVYFRPKDKHLYIADKQGVKKIFDEFQKNGELKLESATVKKPFDLFMYFTPSEFKTSAFDKMIVDKLLGSQYKKSSRPSTEFKISHCELKSGQPDSIVTMAILDNKMLKNGDEKSVPSSYSFLRKNDVKTSVSKIPDLSSSSSAKKMDPYLQNVISLLRSRIKQEQEKVLKKYKDEKIRESKAIRENQEWNILGLVEQQIRGLEEVLAFKESKEISSIKQKVVNDFVELETKKRLETLNQFLSPKDFGYRLQVSQIETESETLRAEILSLLL